MLHTWRWVPLLQAASLCSRAQDSWMSSEARQVPKAAEPRFPGQGNKAMDMLSDTSSASRSLHMESSYCCTKIPSRPSPVTLSGTEPLCQTRPGSGSFICHTDLPLHNYWKWRNVSTFKTPSSKRKQEAKLSNIVVETYTAGKQHFVFMQWKFSIGSTVILFWVFLMKSEYLLWFHDSSSWQFKKKNHYTGHHHPLPNDLF